MGLEGEVAELEVELAAVEERVSLLIHQIEEKMPLYKQVNCSNALEVWQKSAQLKLSFETERPAAG